MRILSYKTLKEASAKYSNLMPALNAWYRIANKAKWEKLDDIRKVWPKTDSVGNFLVFDIKGGAYRLITGVDYEYGKLFIKYVLTHAEYDQEDWKRDPYYRSSSNFQGGYAFCH